MQSVTIEISIPSNWKGIDLVLVFVHYNIIVSWRGLYRIFKLNPQVVSRVFVYSVCVRESADVDCLLHLCENFISVPRVPTTSGTKRDNMKVGTPTVCELCVDVVGIDTAIKSPADRLLGNTVISCVTAWPGCLVSASCRS